MSVRIRLTRMGTHKKAFYRVVVAESNSPRDGKFIDKIGTYDPHLEENKFKIDSDKLKYWIKNGAKPSDPLKAHIKNMLA